MRTPRVNVMNVANFATFSTLAALAGSVTAQDMRPWQELPEKLVAPAGLPTQVPGAKTYRRDVARLGRVLFFDKFLSVDNKTACASCHLPNHGFASKEALPPGSLGRRALRHAPTLYNRAFGRSFSWDGRAKTLEEQVILPIANPNEMALPIADAVGRLRENEARAKEFARLFGRAAHREDLATALASYVRTLLHGDSVVDRFRAAKGHLTKAERAGLWVFESKGGCWKCHSGPNFTDERFHNTGIGVRDGKPLPGRMAISKDARHAGAFKTPTLRGLTETAPFMHDGSLQTLEDVVAFYRRGGNQNPGLSPKVRRLKLNDDEAANLIAFLRALSQRARPPGERPPKEPGKR